MLSEWWVYLPLLASVGLSRVVKKHLPQRELKALTNESWKVGLEFEHQSAGLVFTHFVNLALVSPRNRLGSKILPYE